MRKETEETVEHIEIVEQLGEDGGVGGDVCTYFFAIDDELKCKGAVVSH